MNSQNYFKDHFGATAGLLVNFGSHSNSIGLNIKAYYTDYFFQANSSTTLYLHGKNLGGRTKYLEARNAIGLVLMAGKKQTVVDFQLDGLNHQTPYNFGIGYNYVWYNDNIGTSQRSGGFSIHAKNVSVYHENDVFAGQAKDRFKTGHFYISYKLENMKFGIGVNLWTGETANSKWEKVCLDDAPNGFKNLEDLPYGKTSHGLLYGSFMYNLPFGQNIHLKMGVDSEHIRHGLQNRLLHDLVFLPKKFKRTTPHYPRLDTNGCPVFEKSLVRKDQFYFQFGANDNWSN